MTQKQKILFIHYHYPPIKNSGVYRNYFFSHALIKHFEKAHLITTSNVEILPNELLPISNQMIVHAQPTFDYRTLASFIKGKESVNSGAQFTEKTKSSRLMQFIVKLQRSFPFNVFLAEGSVIYILSSYFLAKRLIKNENIKYIYSSFMPYADHIIAYLLKRKFHELIWIADFRDLHVEPIYKNTFWPKFQKRFEKKILSKANIVTTVSDGISRKMQTLHPNVHTITKGVSLRDTKQSDEGFTIHYSGSLYLEFRDPRPLFGVLFQLISNGEIDKHKIQFIYAGKDGSRMALWAKEQGIEDVFTNRGMLSRNEVLDIQDRAHINLLLTSAGEDHQGLLTGKLFEYIEAGKEIVCWIKGSKDEEIEAMFGRYGLGSVLYEENALADYILAKYQEWQDTGEVKSHHKKEKIMEEMSWQRQAQKLLDLITIEKIRRD